MHLCSPRVGHVWLKTTRLMPLERRCASACAGHVVEGMAVAEAWAASADPSLVRHLILLLLQSVEPPYSQVSQQRGDHTSAPAGAAQP